MRTEWKSAVIAPAVVFAMAAAPALAADKAGKLSKSDSLLARAQRICPVSGKGLFERGGPVKARLGKQTVFLCCKDCLRGKIDPKHFSQVQAHLIAAQGRCPVMRKPLPKQPASTVVAGRAVFVCCPPCTKKIESDPQKYLAIVDAFLEKNLEGEVPRQRMARVAIHGRRP